jgi:NADPH:quinone reductase-like Zn-dependent oxidoreductase
MIGALLSAIFSRKRAKVSPQAWKPADLAVLGDWIEEGKLKPVIDRNYPLREAPQAVAYVAEGHARGKVVIIVDGDS